MLWVFGVGWVLSEGRERFGGWDAREGDSGEDVAFEWLGRWWWGVDY